MISIVCLILLFSTSITIVYGFSNIKYTDNNTEFAVETAEMIEKYDLQERKTSNNSVGNQLRIIGKTSNKRLNFSCFGASRCIVNKDGRFVLQFSDESYLKKCLEELRAMPDILYAEQDKIIYTYSESVENNDETLSWGMSALGLDAYSQYLNSINSENDVIVAVVDSGTEKIDCLKDKLVNGYDFVDNDTDGANDTSIDSHGTFLASIIAECTQNNSVNIMPVRVLESKSGSLINAINGIYFATDNGANIINVSLGGILNDCKSMDDAILYSDSKNVAVVVCSGNLKRDIANYCPAHNEKAITVSSLDKERLFAEEFSNYGEAIDVCAPGVDIVGYNADGKQKTMSGTSMSAAYISAGVALLRLQYPYCNTTQIQNIIRNFCVDLGDRGFDKYYGFGIPQFNKLIFDTTVYVENLNILEDTVVIEKNDSLDVLVNLTPFNATNKKIKWKSENENIVFVNEFGNITAKETGAAIICAETLDGGYQDFLNVVVVESQTPPIIIEISVVEKPIKNNYIYKTEKIDLAGIKLLAEYSDGSNLIITDTDKIIVKNFDAQSIGKKMVVLEYAECETEIEITVEYSWWQWLIRILLLGIFWY